MKKIKRWLRDIFAPHDFNDIDTDAIRAAFNDSSVRAFWLSACFDELKRINLEVDQRLLSGTNLQLTDLCARRRAYQDMLELVLSAKRRVVQETQDLRPNLPSGVNLDRVTA